MTKDKKEETRLYLETFLPDAVAQILESYQDFLNDKDSEQNQEFLAFHKACKVAISNVEQLLKLYKWIEEHGGKLPHEDDIKAMIENSRVRLKSHKKD